MKNILSNKRWMILAALVVLFISAAFTVIPTQAASAAADEPTPTATPDPARQNARLERLFARLQTAQERLETKAEKAPAILKKINEKIALLKAAGVDTRPLEDAVAACVASLTEAKGKMEEAGAILATHAGFDAAGKVIDAGQARQTVREAGAAQKQTRRIAEKAIRDLRQAARDFFRQNKPAPEPQQP